MTLKLFVWEDVLTDYTSGIMFALAENVEQAKEIIRRKYCPTFKCGYCGFGKDFCTLYNELEFEPSIYNESVGFCLWGGG